MSSIKKLLEIMEQLREAENGCPWDCRQDFKSIAPYTIEEAYEVADAIARDDMEGLRDELGDLLFQVVFHAHMAQEQGFFDFDDVGSSINEKLRRRHPHIFGTEEQRRAGQQAGSWEAIKADERAAGNRTSQDCSALQGVALALPALKRAEKLGQRAARTGFDWPDRNGVRNKIDEELAELAEAEALQAAGGIEEELGDLLFAVVNLARHLKVDPENALSAANRKFEQRFRLMERSLLAEGGTLEALSLDQLEAAWQIAKQQLTP